MAAREKVGTLSGAKLKHMYIYIYKEPTWLCESLQLGWRLMALDT